MRDTTKMLFLTSVVLAAITIGAVGGGGEGGVTPVGDPFLGEIRMFGGVFAPTGWAFCDGQLLAISSNTALFSLLGTTFGGDGETTFALPDLRGRSPVHEGSGPGLSPIALGQKGGAENVLLSTANMPNHTHTLRARLQDGNTDVPQDNVLAMSDDMDYTTRQATVDMRAEAITSVGGGQQFGVRSPYQSVNFIIALQGTFPDR